MHISICWGNWYFLIFSCNRGAAGALFCILAPPAAHLSTLHIFLVRNFMTWIFCFYFYEETKKNTNMRVRVEFNSKLHELLLRMLIYHELLHNKLCKNCLDVHWMLQFVWRKCLLCWRVKNSISHHATGLLSVLWYTPTLNKPSTVILCVRLGILCRYLLPFRNFVLNKARRWTTLGKRRKRFSLWPMLTKKSSLRALFQEECLEGKTALHQSKQLASVNCQHQSWHTTHFINELAFNQGPVQPWCLMLFIFMFVSQVSC